MYNLKKHFESAGDLFREFQKLNIKKQNVRAVTAVAAGVEIAFPNLEAP